jgi:hypothetical protein
VQVTSALAMSAVLRDALGGNGPAGGEVSSN